MRRQKEISFNQSRQRPFSHSSERPGAFFISTFTTVLVFGWMMSGTGCSSAPPGPEEGAYSDRAPYRPNAFTDGATRSAFEHRDEDSSPAATLTEKPEERPEPLDPEKLAERYSDAQSRREIVYGMSMRQVSEAWGSPNETEFAGSDPQSRSPASDSSGEGNQRWIYWEGIGAKRYGTASTRILYFESNRLVGWETR